MSEINKDKVIASLVRGFFNAFASGIIDSYVSDSKLKFEPRTVKQVMLTHYEEIAQAFHETIFYPLISINYCYEEAEKVIERGFSKDTTQQIDLVKTACKDDRCHKILIAEYKRNFNKLLGGYYSTQKDFIAEYPKDELAGVTDCSTAIIASVRTVMRAYAKGCTLSKGNLRQASIFRLLLDNINGLLNEVPLQIEKDNNNNALNRMFMKACRNETNFKVMIDAINDTYEEIIKGE